ncbi:MAG: hypothetical protein ACLPYS_05815 [Vulcanimicrobiaceae bacterium]
MASRSRTGVTGSAAAALEEELALRRMTRSAKGTIAEPGRNVAAKSALNRALLDAGFGILGHG